MHVFVTSNFASNCDRPVEARAELKEYELLSHEKLLSISNLQGTISKAMGHVILVDSRKDFKAGF